ncbi:MAG TPA: STN domain-containing protein [Steroidobacteraceae bacterium]
MATAAFWVLLCVSIARADVLDRGVQFEIEAEPLARALIEFSTQGGVQIAVAEADVSKLQSSRVSGSYPVHAALSMLLRGSGLEFVRVGDNTIAIRSAPVVPSVGNIARAGRPAAVAPVQTTSTSQSDATAAKEADLPDVTVIAPRPPTNQELAGDSVYQFVLHHGTTHYPISIGVVGSLTRWRGGRSQTICP